MEIICYKPSPGKEFFNLYCLAWIFFFGTDVTSGWKLKLHPYLQYRVSVYTQIFKAEKQEIQFPLLYTKPSKDKQKFLSFKGW